MSVTSFALLLLASAACAQIPGPYHDEVGIPAAAALWRREVSYQAWRASHSVRIVGGTPSITGEHPYFTGLLIKLVDGKSSLCGGSLLSNTRVVTAAHCWWDGRNQASNFTVVLGSTTLFFGGRRVATSNVTIHQQYDPSTLWNDIAVAFIPYVKFTRNFHPIALPVSLNLTLEGQHGQVVGFGVTGDDASITLTQSLRDVFVQLVNNSVCGGVYGPVVYEGTLCSSGKCGRGPCGGDSGGPIAVRVDGRPVLVGIVSFGSARGCEIGYPSGFTRVPYFLSWIQERL